MKKAKVLIITGYGINCDVETSWAFQLAGADEVKTTHLNRIINKEVNINDYSIFVIPGGFSFGDHIASGKVLALKIKMELREMLEKFIAEGKLVMGICNGFQVLVKMGLLPGGENSAFEKQTVTLTANDSAKYEDRWIRLKPNKENNSPFLKGLDSFPAAIRHGEGKFIAPQKEIDRLVENNMIAFQYVDEKDEVATTYPQNPNGSMLSIASITNKQGNVIGMMPHPEVFVVKTQHPQWQRIKDLPEEGAGLAIFKNAVNFVKNDL